MKLVFIGSGSAFTVGSNNYQSNMFIETPSKKRLLIDCGTDIRLGLYELGLTYSDFNGIYISHLHADHVGGLEWIAFQTCFNSCEKPTLFTSKYIVEDLWNNVLCGGLSSIEEKQADLSTFFQVCPVGDEGIFRWDENEFWLVKTRHVLSNHRLRPSYGLFFTLADMKIFLTTDARLSDTFLPYYQMADLIFHDCETSKEPSGVHAHYKELRTLDTQIKKKMWLYHYNPGTIPDYAADGFLGFVKKGQSFEF